MTEEKKKLKGVTKIDFKDPVAAASYWAREAARTHVGPTARAIKAIQAGQDVKLIARQRKKDEA